MQKIIEKESILKTRIMVSEDGNRTYSITKTIEGLEGGR